MYLSLDRIDVTLQPLAERPRFIQTDHRTAAEIEGELPLSIVATAIRCLNPLRSAANAAVFYNFAEPPPQRVRQAVAMCGGLPWAGTDVSIVERTQDCLPVDEANAARILDESLSELSSELLVTASSSNPADTLKALEQRLLEQGFPDEDDTSEFWSTVLNMGALAGAAIRASVGGQWFYHPASLGTLPVDFRTQFNGGPATVNLLGKALKFLRGKGDGEEPSFLVHAVCRTA